jgi:hypothetical protein
MRQTLVLLLLLATMLVGCSPERNEFSEVKAQVSVLLTDPDAALFRNIRPDPAGFGWCGEVNTKNLFGGYVGYQPFFAIEPGDDDPGWVVLIVLPDTPAASHDLYANLIDRSCA